MWWKLTLATVIGICIGLAAPTLPRSYFHRGAVETPCCGYFHLSWPSTGKNWPEFANWLRHGGRMLYLGRAFTLAKRGLNEDEVRAIFGPPDLVFDGVAELAGFRQTNRQDAAGAYIYKVGPFADPSIGRIANEIFIIIFNQSGKIMSTMNIDVKPDHKLADVDSDTRSDRRIVSSQ